MSQDIAPSLDQIAGFAEEPSRKKPGSFHGKHLGPRIFSGAGKGDGVYALHVPQLGISLHLDRLRRERHDLIGELSVTCELEGAKTVDGRLTIADFNISSFDARTKRANVLAARSMAPEIDWLGLIEEICQRVIMSERTGEPAINLSTHPKPDMSQQHYHALGLTIPQHHPSILFGDGGVAKSYIVLKLCGMLKKETRVGYFDWELDADEHRHRLEQLFGADMPDIAYVKCDKALVHDIDRLINIVREEGIDYAVFDSIVFACAGPPESAEVAAEYFRSVRRLNIGSLHVAHVSKAETGDMKPFGSTFWHNGARATWNVKRDEGLAPGDCLPLTIYTRKANMSALGRPVSIDVRFDGPDVLITQTNRVNTPVSPENNTLAMKIRNLLKTHGPMTIRQLTQHAQHDQKVLRGTVERELGKTLTRNKVNNVYVFSRLGE